MMRTSWMLLAATAFTAALASAPTFAADDECTLTIEGNDQMQFNKEEMTVPASCNEVTIELEHTGEMAADVMGHNWVLAESSVSEEVATAGMQAGMDNDYLPQDDDRIIAHTEIVGGGETTSVTFSTADLADKDLTFFCSFPGHYAPMHGKFIVKQE
ncbi:azurin [Pistricoccus aurantiacus]|uniref:Azurin n=1 Tax=Pistricoccus aurantiacus TaxID=1883414 RepID=A0A5B8SPC4_9GAMM|nr:azurin [Pistricoccus aurantiacus]QEA38161.1 azurin [Pistricoccus aurantiacus]